MFTPRKHVKTKTRQMAYLSCRVSAPPTRQDKNATGRQMAYLSCRVSAPQTCQDENTTSRQMAYCHVVFPLRQHDKTKTHTTDGLFVMTRHGRSQPLYGFHCSSQNSECSHVVMCSPIEKNVLVYMGCKIYNYVSMETQSRLILKVSKGKP